MFHWFPSILLLLVVPAVASAQVVQDTTDWQQYFPLEVGNSWQFRYTRNDQPMPPGGYEIVADTLVGNQRYYALTMCQAEGEIPCVSSTRQYLRYDDTNRMIVEWVPGSAPIVSRWRSIVPCALDAPFGATDIRCRSEDSETAYTSVEGGYGRVVTVGADVVSDIAVKQYIGGQGRYDVAAGLGLFHHIYCNYSSGSEVCFQSFLHYAKVGGTKRGTPLFAFPTAAEEGEPQPSPRNSLSAAPNPARGSVRIRLTVQAPALVRVDAFDVLGREVALIHDGTLSTGAHDLTFDTFTLPDGVYVVHASANSWSVSTQLVVAR
jgi:hypothetical protein